MPRRPDLIRLADHFKDFRWRLSNLYWITSKEGQRIKFELNWAQQEFLREMHAMNVILKARQLGMTTFIQLFMLDQTVWNSNVKAGTIAHTLGDAMSIFSEKVKYPYDNLPDGIRDARGRIRDSRSELALNNNSSIRVGTSLRSGTLNYLHVSEYGKLCAKYPEKAREVRTGALNTVQAGQWVSVESTAEGQEGGFFDMCSNARSLQRGCARLTELDFKFHFFPWWKEPAYRINPDGVVISADYERYFVSLEDRHGIFTDAAQRAWYVKKAGDQLGDMKREFPSCIAGNVLVATTSGLVPIRDVVPDGTYITRKFSKGIAPVFSVRTKLGYECISTGDHPYLCDDGLFRQLNTIAAGQRVVIAAQSESGFGRLQTVSYRSIPFVESTITIDEEFGRFLGIYMGDGSFYEGTLSIACDAQDRDFIEIVRGLLSKFVGDPYLREIGPNKGGVEVRVSRKELIAAFDALGILRRACQEGSGKLMRNVCVPSYINRSPRNVVRAFLQGIFETDGFAQRNGTGVKLFSKYDYFLRDVQLLLLQFGITARLSSHDKVNTQGYRYTGWELCLRTEEGRRFWEEIGFLSARKQARIAYVPKPDAPYACRRSPLDFIDEIASIEQIGESDVYDITTSTAQFSAGGLVVHNCPDEAFEASVEGAYYGAWIEAAETQGRIGEFKADLHYPVHTSWDLGVGDSTAIWFFQIMPGEVRIVGYFEASGEGLPFYADLVKKWYAANGWSRDGAIDFVPHDARVREWGTKKTRLEQMVEAGFNPRIPTAMSIDDGINAVRAILPQCKFDAAGSAEGLKSLKAYRKSWNEEAGCWRNEPLHNFASHGADGFRYLAAGHRDVKPAPVKPKASPVGSLTFNDLMAREEALAAQARHMR